MFCKTFLLTDFGFVCPDECFVTPLLHWLELPRSRESGGVLSDVARLLTGLASPLSGVCVCVPVGGYIAVYLDIMNRLTRWYGFSGGGLCKNGVRPICGRLSVSL